MPWPSSTFRSGIPDRECEREDLAKDSAGGRVDPDLVPIEMDRAAAWVAQTKQCFGDFGASGAHQAVEPQNLATAHLKTDVFK